MPAGLALSRAEVTRFPPHGDETAPPPASSSWPRASVVVRGGRLAVSVGRQTVASGTAVSVVQESRNTWRVTMDDGSQYTVVRAKGCGCGG